MYEFKFAEEKQGSARIVVEEGVDDGVRIETVRVDGQSTSVAVDRDRFGVALLAMLNIYASDASEVGARALAYARAASSVLRTQGEVMNACPMCFRPGGGGNATVRVFERELATAFYVAYHAAASERGNHVRGRR